jgi:hypothetical protein
MSCLGLHTLPAKPDIRKPKAQNEVVVGGKRCAADVPRCD